ncbi:hypothetical protein LTR10_024175 [Elasticomyces elasticus]|uniref:Myb-like domain-containing protein n=1 Tax=Exophiala sideris TaxID=1016849 RepID=A0ABR0IU65_9EURO|nr:hypothetical protein LTR10_024175 [Elasticomyces elasticus]KAK5020811.1 hypothetical protein LTS07_011419 [Exophiala sideris]KAK5022855.1 hypothetical protein LTR13_011389 [Exophiala sideris]KAK5048133.1 hypothetical protein LTR69_011435 [Exophiala sideris]KAK5176029.1 hypothetical protein LTR44_011414 [Eurotiomycetes sp. CCFEE 6388]
MDNVIFEDPSKPRVRPERLVRAAPASSEATSIRECPHEVQPQAVTPVSDIRPQEHSHTTSVGHSEPISLEGRQQEISIHEMWRSSLHDPQAEADGRISGAISLHDDFSLAQTDDDGLAEGLDDDLWSLFSGGPPDVEPSRTAVCAENPDGRTQNNTSQGTETRDDLVNTSSGDGLSRAGTPSLGTDVDAMDLTTRSNNPQLKLTGGPPSRRCCPPSSRHKPGLEVVTPSRCASARAERSASSVQLANVVERPNGVRRRTASPSPGGRVEHLSGRKRRYRSGSDFLPPDSRRQRVEAESNKTPSVCHRTSGEGSAGQTRRTENQHGTLPVVVRTPNAAHGPDSEQTLVGRGANSNCEDKIVPDLSSGEPSPTPTTSLDIDESMNSHHEHDQHHGGLKSMSVQPVAAADAAFITAIIDSPADLQNVFHSPTAWALGCGVRPASLTNISVKPFADHCWLLTATISRRASGTNDLRQDPPGRRERWSPDPDTSSDYYPSEGERGLRPRKRGHWTAEEDDDLTRWRRLGKSWWWIFDRFPDRSEAAVRSRWFVVLAPRTRLDARVRT